MDITTALHLAAYTSSRAHTLAHASGTTPPFCPDDGQVSSGWRKALRHSAHLRRGQERGDGWRDYGTTCSQAAALLLGACAVSSCIHANGCLCGGPLRACKEPSSISFLFFSFFSHVQKSCFCASFVVKGALGPTDTPDPCVHTRLCLMSINSVNISCAFACHCHATHGWHTTALTLHPCLLCSRRTHALNAHLPMPVVLTTDARARRAPSHACCAHDGRTRSTRTFPCLLCSRRTHALDVHLPMHTRRPIKTAATSSFSSQRCTHRSQTGSLPRVSGLRCVRGQDSSAPQLDARGCIGTLTSCVTDCLTAQLPDLFTH
jgi:hypothetical protein